MEEVIKILQEDPRHLYFFIEEHRLFQVYETSRGSRFRLVDDVPGLPDTAKCDYDQLLNQIKNLKS